MINWGDLTGKASDNHRTFVDFFVVVAITAEDIRSLPESLNVFSNVVIVSLGDASSEVKVVRSSYLHV